MGKFLQLHLLTNYGPANLNRDDLNRPKTAIIGGVQRLRVSSQCLKRAWRTSEVFEVTTGIRTKEMGSKIFSALMMDMNLQDILEGKNSAMAKKSEISEKDAKEWAWKITSVFVDKMKKDGKAGDESEGEEEEEKTKSKKKKKSNVDKNTLKAEQIVFYYPEEIENISRLIEKLKKEKKAPTEKEINDLLVTKGAGADVGMFGRMMACSPLYNVESAATVSPTGKQNSFASRAYASYILAEKGDKQPRSLAGAYLKPISGEEILDDSIALLKQTRDMFNKVYKDETKPYELNGVKGDGTLEGLKKYCVEE